MFFFFLINKEYTNMICLHCSSYLVSLLTFIVGFMNDVSLHGDMTVDQVYGSHWNLSIRKGRRFERDNPTTVNSHIVVMLKTPTDRLKCLFPAGSYNFFNLVGPPEHTL